MAKISISLPDDLKERLDSYADQHHQSISSIIQQALTALLDDGAIPIPTPGGSDMPADFRLLLVEQYLQGVWAYSTAVQDCLKKLASQVPGVQTPPPLPSPPWS